MKIRRSFALERVSRHGRRCRQLVPLCAFGVLLAHLSACVEDADPEPGASAGSSGTGATAMDGGGASGAGGSSSTPSAGGSGGSGGAGSEPYTSDPDFGAGMRCPPVTQALLSDFTPVLAAGADAGADAAAGGPASGASFGDFTTTLSGSTFVYPGAGMYAVHSDVSGGSWHLTGTLGDYSGFGISFANCYLVDASAYQGISFTVQGSVPMGSTITLNVGTAADDVSSVWLKQNTNPTEEIATNAGRCLPASNQYDGTCSSPNRAVPVSAEPTTINVPWAELTGGRPAPAVDPKEITGISWNFPPPAGIASGMPVPYEVDITIDDLRFIE